MLLYQKERKQNRELSDVYTEDQAVDKFIYLTNKERYGGHTTEYKIRKAYRQRRLGTMLRKLDFIAFNTN